MKQDEQHLQQKNKSGEPEWEKMDHFEFMTKTVKVLSKKIDEIDDLVKRTANTLEGQ